MYEIASLFGSAVAASELSAARKTARRHALCGAAGTGHAKGRLFQRKRAWQIDAAAAQWRAERDALRRLRRWATIARSGIR